MSESNSKGRYCENGDEVDGVGSSSSASASGCKGGGGPSSSGDGGGAAVIEFSWEGLGSKLLEIINNGNGEGCSVGENSSSLVNGGLKKKKKKKKNKKKNVLTGLLSAPPVPVITHRRMTMEDTMTRCHHQDRSWKSSYSLQREFSMEEGMQMGPALFGGREDRVVTSIKLDTLGKEVFEKKFCLKAWGQRPPQIALNLFPGARLWNVEELSEQKERLNKTKGLLDDLNLGDWHQHTKRMNTAGGVIPLVKSEVNPEFGTQAWCKMWECLNSYPLIPKVITDAAVQPELGAPVRFFSVHLCEAPGAFVSSLNHFIHQNYPQIQWDWLATTLNPYHEGNDVGNMINEDRLIVNSRQNWTFLKDSTGNIMNIDNINSLISEVRERAKNFHQVVNLVTADGSIDCQFDPSRQEKNVLDLQFAEIVTALSILGAGGNFLLKIFTFLECQTVNHLYLLCSLFKEVNLFKPATSKEGNSEVYVICLGFIGRDFFRSQLERLKEEIGKKEPLTSTHSLFGFMLVMPNAFGDQLVRAAKFFTEYQMAIIRRNIGAFVNQNCIGQTYSRYDILKQEVAYEWFARFNLRILPKKYCLFRLLRMNYQLTHVDPRVEVGSFRDKQKLQSDDIKVKLEEVLKHLELYEGFCSGQWRCRGVHGQCNELKTLTGRRYKDILSSRFCFGKLLQMRHDLKQALLNKFILYNRNLEDCEHCSNPVENYVPFAGDVVTHCFKLGAKQIIEENDFQRTVMWLKEILSLVLNLKRNQSLYLCGFPLLSRLQFGFIYALTSVFYSISICSGRKLDGEPEPRGILLNRYRLISSQSENDVINTLAEVVANMSNPDDIQKDETVVELVPMKNLIDQQSFGFIMQYNISIVTTELEQLVDAAKSAHAKPVLEINLTSSTKKDAE